MENIRILGKTLKYKDIDDLVKQWFPNFQELKYVKSMSQNNINYIILNQKLNYILEKTRLIKCQYKICYMKYFMLDFATLA